MDLKTKRGNWIMGIYPRRIVGQVHWALDPEARVRISPREFNADMV